MEQNYITRDESDFIWEAGQGNLERVKELTYVIENVDVKNKKGSTALHWAAFKGDIEMTKFLLSRHAYVNVRDKHLKTPLQYAASYGHDDIVKELLNYNADPDLADEKGDSPLHCAAFNMHDDIVQELITHRAEINCQNNAGITPFNTSLLTGNTWVAQMFLHAQADFLIDKYKRNPLHCAARAGRGNRYGCLKTVIEALPAEKKLLFINGQDREGQTPLHYAAGFGSVQNVLLLIKHGARVNMRDYIKERTPLHGCLRNHKGAAIHAESIDEYLNKQDHRLSNASVLNVIAALKTAPDLDVNTFDCKGLSVYDCIDRIHYDTQQEKDAIMDAVFNPNTKNAIDLPKCLLRDFL